MLQRMVPHRKLGIFGSKTIGGSAFAAGADALVAVGVGGSAFEQPTRRTKKSARCMAALIVAL